MARYLSHLVLGRGRLWLMVLITTATITSTTKATTTTAATSSESQKNFKQDVDLVGEAGSGERLQLRSEGILEDMVDLDSIPQIKRVVCTGNRLLLALTDATVAHGWKPGQLVLGGPQWNCNASAESKSPGVRIYVKIAKVVVTVEGRKNVTGGVDMAAIYHVPAGPFDMLKEANIHFHYQPPALKDQEKRRHQRQHNGPRSARPRRSASNPVSSILDNIDWQANVTSIIPLDIGDDSGTLALHKTWGQRGLSQTTGTSATSVSDDFVLLFDKLDGESRVSYTFDLVIKNVNGAPDIVRYISQFDVEADMEADATVKFSREMGVTYNVTVRESPIQELLRVPVINTIGGLPPINLVLTSQSVVSASVRAYSSGPSALRTGYTGSGFLTSSQTFNPDVNQGNDVTSHGWSFQPSDQSLVSHHRTEADLSLQQKVTFNASLSWHESDIDLELSPPAEITFRQLVSLRSRQQDMVRCVDSQLNVDAEVHTAASQFTVTAFGLQLWDVPLTPAMSRTLRLSDTPLGYFCDADCPATSASQILSNLTQPSPQTFTRADQRFQSLRSLDGDLVLLLDDQRHAAWCGSPGAPCYSCHSQTYGTPPERTCASRLMTPRMAAAVSHLAGLVEAEWPQRQLLITEAWDEATSLNPSGIHPLDSLYKQGRAVTLGLATRPTTSSSSTTTSTPPSTTSSQAPPTPPSTTSSQAPPTPPSTTSSQAPPTPPSTTSSQAPPTPAPPQLLTLDPQTAHRLGQLAVRAGLEHVQREVADGTLKVKVREDGTPRNMAAAGVAGVHGEDEVEDFSDEFWDAMENMNVDALYPHCVSAPRVDPGSTWPDVTGNSGSPGKPESICGPVDKRLLRNDWTDMARLVQFDKDNGSLTFNPEALQEGWCGISSRRCLTNCSAPSRSSEPWDWCSTRMMTPRLALRLRILQKLAEKEGFALLVTQGFRERTGKDKSPPDLFSEGRALRLRTKPAGRELTLASLAVCAGLNFVEHAHDGHVSVYVNTQHGYRSQNVQFMEGSTHTVVPPAYLEDKEHAIPTDDLKEEGGVPSLVDGGYRPDVHLSEHLTASNVTSRGNRYFRLDETLLLCIELVIEDFSLPLEIVEGSAYRTRSDNFLRNLDARHEDEQWRHQTGQAVRLRPLHSTTSQSLFQLAESVLRKCPSLAQPRLKAVGLGCHSDSIYVDIRPPELSGSLGYVKVWNTGTDYCRDVTKLRAGMLTGGPVINSDVTVTCADRGLDPGLEFLSFQMGQTDLCDLSKQSEFCASSLSARRDEADKLHRLLTRAAGHGRLPTSEIIDDVRECLVNHCGGCMGSGTVFDKKVRHCSRMVHKYLKSAAAPYPDLTNVTTFFNTNADDSTVHGAACKEDGNVCMEETIIYSLLLPSVTARFYPDQKTSVEKELFGAAVNPTPLLDIAAQELAARASGLVTVFVQEEKDTYILRNVLKVLLAYNKNVSRVDIQVAPGADKDLITSSIQRKVSFWAGTTCPEHSRFTIAPFRVVDMEPHRHKRSAELSQARNAARSDIYDWESEWLRKMI